MYDLLRNIPLFSQLVEENRAELSSLLQSKDYASQQPIFWIGEKGDQMFIVQGGKVHLSYPDETGHEITVGVLGPGAFFGELSRLDGGPRTATARTIAVATLAHRQREAMEKLRGVKNINEEIKERITPLQKLVDKAATFAASGWFLLGNTIF